MEKNRLKWFYLMAILLCTGCQFKAQPESPAIDPHLDGIINGYLVENIGIKGFDGEVFCAYETLEAGWSTKGEIYLWVLCLEYYWGQGSLVSGSGISLPVALQTHLDNDQLKITGHLIPRDGTYYGPDVREIFPRRAWSQILPNNEDQINRYNQRAEELTEETLLKAREYYSIED